MLEDQLKLMDEKFLELRSKLDVTRENLAKQIKAAKKESFELRTKYAAITQGGSLDKVRLPESSNGGTWPMNRTTNSDSRPGSGTLSPEQIVSGEFTRPAPIDVNRMPAADLDAMQSVRQHRSKSVDFIPQAMSLPQSPHRLSVSVRHSQPLQVQQNFLVGLKSNVPTEASRSQQSVGSPAHRQISPPPATGSRPQSASAPSPNVRASTNSASGYGSGGNQISNGIASSHRPRSAVPFQDTKSRTATATSSRAFNERILTHVVRKIDRKSGKRSGWTADRMLELLG